MEAHIVVSAKSTRFAASEFEARQLRQSMVDRLEIPKKHISINAITIPTTKADLLAFLNDREAAHEEK